MGASVVAANVDLISSKTPTLTMLHTQEAPEPRYQNITNPTRGSPATTEAVAVLSTLFVIIGFTGITGNLMVVYAVLSDTKMRKSPTNVFIVNLAIADLLIMLFGVPEIAQVMMNQGWLLGEECCKINRYILVASLYASIMSLVAVSVER